MQDDVIIVGGGHNGLIAAAYLAKAGLRVRLFEARPIFGGACVTEEIAGHPGFKISTGAAQIGNLKPQIIADLDLRRYGFALLTPDPLSVFPFPDGRYLAMWDDPARTAASIATFSAADAAALPQYFADLDAVCHCLEACIDSCLDSGAKLSIDQLEQAFATARIKRLFGPFITGSIASLMDHYFTTDEIKAVIGYTATFGTNAGPLDAGTAYVMTHHMLGNVTGRRGRSVYVRGGMGGLSNALARAAKHYGATLVSGTKIANIITQNGSATGVETIDGQRFDARAVISNADPKTTYLGLVGPANLDSNFVERISAIETNGVAIKVNCALDQLPRFSCLPDDITPPRVSICPSLAYVETAWQAARHKQLPSHPYMTLHMQSAIDPALAPAGKHTLTCYAQFFPYDLDPASGGWARQAQQAERVVLDTVAAFAPDIRDVMIGCETVTPVDLERVFGMTGGHQFHGDLMPGNLFDQRAATDLASIDRLYLCGAGAHPGGCVWGAPAEQAVRRVKADLG